MQNLLLTVSQAIDSSWKPIHIILVKQQKNITNFLFSLEIVAGLSLPIVAAIVYAKFVEFYALFRSLGDKFGTLAILMFCLSLLPGILKRLRLLPLMSSSMVLFRRHIGILSYVLMINHSLINFMLPLILRKSFQISLLSQREIVGLIAEALLFPLWLTSNDWSVKYFGRFWKWIQRLSYLAFFFILIHVAIMQETIALVLILVGIVEVCSWIKHWFFSPKIAVTANQST